MDIHFECTQCGRCCHGLRLEAAVTRRLDRLTKQNEKLEFQIEVTNEALALFVRFWLTANPPLPESAMAAAQAQGKERYEGFVEALARKLETGRRRRGCRCR